METVHKITFRKGEFSKHITFEPRKYSCKACHIKVGHSLANIRQHDKMHDLTLEQYETKYETAPNENPISASTVDAISKLLDDSVNSKIVQISKLLADDKKDGKILIKLKDVKEKALAPVLENRKRKAVQDNRNELQPKHSKSTSRNIDQMQLFLEKIRSKNYKFQKREETENSK